MNIADELYHRSERAGILREDGEPVTVNQQRIIDDQIASAKARELESNITLDLFSKMREAAR